MLLPLVTVALAQLWTFALLGALDRPLNGVTATVPLLLAILGLVYSVHVISAYYDELRAAPERAPAESMVRALRRIALPMLLGALTTAASLLAAAVTPVGALRAFAWLALMGILVAFGAAVTVTPALLLAFGRPTGFARGAAPPPDRFARFAAATTRALLNHRRTLIWGFIVFFGLSLFAATRLQISTDVPHALPRDDATRLDFDALNRRLDGATTLRVVVEASRARRVRCAGEPRRDREARAVARGAARDRRSHHARRLDRPAPPRGGGRSRRRCPRCPWTRR